MQGRYFLGLCAALWLGSSAHALFINEIHYDNAGSDVGEGIEIAGTAGTSLDGLSLVFYNGGNGQVYRSVALSGTLSNQSDGYGTSFFAVSGLQNGGPDGMALVSKDQGVMQFLSYEGSFVATDGAAVGLTSTDIGLSQDGSGAKGESLQLVGTGLHYADFTWALATASYGAINDGQVFDMAPVPLPATLPLLLSAGGLLAALRRQPRAA